MPWTDRKDALSHTKKADTPEKQDAWLEAANRAMQGGASDGEAVRAGNSAVKHHGDKMHVVRAVAHRQEHVSEDYLDRVKRRGH